jgi:Helix-turn-helix
MSRTQPDQGFIKRLEEIIGHFPSRAALAKAANLPPSSLQSYIEGAEPTRPALVAIARAANISLEWLADNRGYKKLHPPVPDGYVEIPVYDIRKSGGYVYPLVTSDIASWIYLQLDWFNYPDMQPAKLFVVEAIRSLAPEIKDGDLLVIDSSWQSRFAEGKATIPSGNYLISRQAKLFVREATASRSDTVEFVRPDAPGRKETFHVGEDGFAIHGRILWFGRTLALAKITRNLQPHAKRTGNP